MTFCVQNSRIRLDTGNELADNFAVALLSVSRRRVMDIFRAQVADDLLPRKWVN